MLGTLVKEGRPTRKANLARRISEGESRKANLGMREVPIVSLPWKEKGVCGRITYQLMRIPEERPQPS